MMFPIMLTSTVTIPGKDCRSDPTNYSPSIVNFWIGMAPTKGSFFATSRLDRLSSPRSLQIKRFSCFHHMD